MEDESRGCGVVGRFPRGGERGAVAGPALEFRLAREPLSCSLYEQGAPDNCADEAPGYVVCLCPATTLMTS